MMNVIDIPTTQMATPEHTTSAEELAAPHLDQQQLELWEERAKLLRIMAHPMRLVVLSKLFERPHCVKHLNAIVDISQPKLSQHIAALRNAGLIACHACGPVRCYYILRPTLVKQLLTLLLEEHTTVELNCKEIVAQARQGWEEEMGDPCEEA